MTRGQKGCCIYCTDKKLSDYLKKRLNQKDEIIYSIDEDENKNTIMVAEDKEEYRVEYIIDENKTPDFFKRRI